MAPLHRARACLPESVKRRQDAVGAAVDVATGTALHWVATLGARRRSRPQEQVELVVPQSCQETD